MCYEVQLVHPSYCDAMLHSQEDEDKGKAQVMVAKQRNGPTGNVNVTFIDRFARFENSATVAAPEAEAVFNG